MKKQPQAIILREGVLIIPRFFLPIQSIRLDQVRSLEKYQKSGETIAALIGRFNNSSVFIERRMLLCESEFDNLFSCLYQSASRYKNLVGENQNDDYEIERKNALYANILFASIFSLIYILTALPNFNAIADEAIAQGGLTKDSLFCVNFYRIGSSFFLHASPIHLLVNIIALVSVGQGIVAICGRMWFIHLLLSSALFGSLVSLMLSSYAFVIGASGGILGLYGAYFVLCKRWQNKIPAGGFISNRSMLVILAIQLTLDCLLSDVDLSSHIGGLAYGFVSTTCLLHDRSLEKVRNSIWHSWFATVCSVIYVIGLTKFLLIYIF